MITGSASDVLWVSAAALAVTSACLTAFGLRQHRYRGWRWWVGALWLTTAGLAAAGSPALAVPATLLLIQWPILALVGLRRFHARTRLPARERIDWTVLALAAAAAASSPLWPADSAAAALMPATAAALLHLYAACLLFAVPDGQDATPLRWLGITMSLVALAPIPAAWPGYDTMVPIELRGVAAALGAVVMAFVALSLVCARTERQLHDSHDRLRVLANMDSLTHVPNRRHFHELATLALRVDTPGSAALMMFDIDHFKRINDRLGHAAGDRALRLVAASMQEHLRAQDIAGRHGGDEFVLMLRETRVRDAGGVAARIVERLQDQAEMTTLPVLSLSFGMVQLLSGESIDDALRRADQALYEAKRQGRSRAVTAHGGEAQPVFSDSRRLGLTPG
jgi:diguanylate cyclase